MNVEYQILRELQAMSSKLDGIESLVSSQKDVLAIIFAVIFGILFMTVYRIFRRFGSD